MLGGTLRAGLFSSARGVSLNYWGAFPAGLGLPSPSLEEEDARPGLLLWSGAALLVAEAGRGLGVAGGRWGRMGRPAGPGTGGLQGWKRRTGPRVKLGEP